MTSIESPVPTDDEARRHARDLGLDATLELAQLLLDEARQMFRVAQAATIHTPLLVTEAELLRSGLPPGIREARMVFASLMAELPRDHSLRIAAADCDDADARAARGYRG